LDGSADDASAEGTGFVDAATGLCGKDGVADPEAAGAPTGDGVFPVTGSAAGTEDDGSVLFEAGTGVVLLMLEAVETCGITALFSIVAGLGVVACEGFD